MRFAGFNALRAMAALGVVAGHTLATSPLRALPHLVVENLATGVALFFVISGFLLYRPFVASLVKPERVRILRFAANRATRILPLYVVVVVIVFATTQGDSTQSGLRLLRALTFTGIYSGDDLLPVAWSLDDEVAFYFLLPFMYLALMLWPRSNQRLWLGVIVTAILCLASLGLLATRPGEQGIGGGPFTKFHLFGAGMLLASLHARWPRLHTRPSVQVAGALVIVCGLAGSSIAYDQHRFGFSVLSGVTFFVVVGLVAFSGPSSRLLASLSFRPLLLLGDVSYGIYLWHEPVHHALYNFGLLSPQFLPAFLELGCCTVALATGTYYLIEKPALRINQRWAHSSRPDRGDHMRANVGRGALGAGDGLSPSSGRVRPDVVYRSDDRFGLGAVLQIVDIGLAAGRVEWRLGAARVRIRASTLTPVPDVSRCQEDRFSTSGLDLANLSCGGVHDVRVGPAAVISGYVGDLSAAWRRVGPNPRHARKKR